MNENDLNQNFFYITLKNKPTSEIKIVDNFALGANPRSDYILPNNHFAPQFIEIKKHEKRYVLHYFGEDATTKINDFYLEKNKNYLIEENDTISAFDLKIEYKKRSKSYIKSSVIQKPIENAKEHKNDIKTDIKTDQGQAKILWKLKLYSILIDFILTYGVLIFIIPRVSLQLPWAINALLDNFMANIQHFSISSHSFIKYFIIWYGLNFGQNLVIGTTLGQILVGLKNKKETSFIRIIGQKTKSFLISLLMIPGQNSSSAHIIFKLTRFLLIPALVLFILIFPWFMYRNFPPQVYLELSSVQMNSSLKIHNTSLLLPFWNDIQSFPEIKLLNQNQKDESLNFDRIEIIESLAYKEFEMIFQYANPFYSVFKNLAFQELRPEEIKEIILPFLASRSNDLKYTFSKLGPFYGSLNQLKSRFYQKITHAVKIKSYRTFYLLTTQNKIAFALYFAKSHLFVLKLPTSFITKLVKNNQYASSVDFSFLNAVTLDPEGINQHSLLTYYQNKVKSLISNSSEAENQLLMKEYKKALLEGINIIRLQIKDEHLRSEFTLLFDQLGPI